MSTAADKHKRHEDIIDLSLGDPDIITHDEITKHACIDAINGYTKYAPPAGDIELIEEIIKFRHKDDMVSFFEYYQKD